MTFSYHKPQPYYYQTFDRSNLQFTNIPLYVIHQPQPPAPPSEEPVEGDSTGDAEPSTATDTPETALGTFYQWNRFQQWD